MARIRKKWKRTAPKLPTTGPLPDQPSAKLFAYFWLITGDRKTSLVLANYYKQNGFSYTSGQRSHIQMWKRPSTQRVLKETVEEMGKTKRIKVGRPKDTPEAQLDCMEDVIATAEEVLIYLTACMRGKISEEVLILRTDGPGSQIIERLRKEVTPRDRTKAAELLAKRYGLLEQKVSMNIKAPVVFSGEEDLEE